MSVFVWEGGQSKFRCSLSFYIHLDILIYEFYFYYLFRIGPSNSFSRGQNRQKTRVFNVPTRSSACLFFFISRTQKQLVRSIHCRVARYRVLIYHIALFRVPTYTARQPASSFQYSYVAEYFISNLNYCLLFVR